MFKKFEKSKLHVDKDIFNAARYKLIFNKKRAFFQNKLTESIGKAKDLRKILKSLGLPNKVSFCEVKAFKIKNTVEHDVNSVLEWFKSYYSTLADNLEKLLSKPPNKYSVNTVVKYYGHMIQSDHFNWHLFPKAQF